MPMGAAAHISPRHLNRALVAEVSATSGQLMRTRTASCGATVAGTDRPGVADILLPGSFGSVRQFNDVIREHFSLTPRQLRSRRRVAAVQFSRERWTSG